MTSPRSPRPHFVALTGGPGGGKTAVLEVVRRNFLGQVDVLAESASIVFKGGFPRRPTLGGRRAAQRAILGVQRELERLASEESEAELVVCDRGTVDCVAYWPDGPTTLLEEMGSTRERELARYVMVVHLRPPPHGVPRDPSSVRTESAAEALEIDARIERAWDGHPNRVFVESTPRFLDKVQRVVELVRRAIRPDASTGPSPSPA